MDNAAWKRVHNLRQSYLAATDHLPEYWQDEELLAAYDETLAQRIRWKWRAVLDVLPVPLAELPATVVDWGCGTGGASRELLSYAASATAVKKLILWDRSQRAMNFAAGKVRREFPSPGLTISHHLPRDSEPYILLISHVLSELSEAELSKLLPLLANAQYLLWVESGRLQESRRLSQLRETLRPTHEWLAPCPHQEVCGMLAAKQEENWCHFKAPVPKEIHQSAFWRECAERLGFDLRSLPVAYLFGQRKTAVAYSGDAMRVLAGSRQYKGYTRFNACHKSGIVQADFMKRHCKKTYAQLSEPGLGSIYAWQDLMNKEKSPS